MNKKNKKDGPYLHDILDEEWEPLEEDFSDELLDLEDRYQAEVDELSELLEVRLVPLIQQMDYFLATFKELAKAKEKLGLLKHKLDLEDECECDDC